MAHKPIDWSQRWYPGPKRPFTADEMARFGSEGPSRTLLAIAAINIASVAFVLLQVTPAAQTAALTGALVALVVLGTAAARWLWWRPWRRPLMQAQLAVVAAMLLLAIGIRWRVPARADREALAIALAVGCALLTVLLWSATRWSTSRATAATRASCMPAATH